MNTRREFIKQSCGICFGAIGLGFISSSLSSCASLPIYKTSGATEKIEVPIASFLQNKSLIVRTDQLTYDILLVKNSNEQYTALYMQCTHQDNSLTATEKGLFCPSHGSTFDLNGLVTKEPALKPLQKFKTEINNQQIIIYLKS